MSRRGPIQKAVIVRIADQRGIPLAAAAHAYDMMGIDRKKLLCLEEQRRQESNRSPVPADREGGR